MAKYGEEEIEEQGEKEIKKEEVEKEGECEQEEDQTKRIERKMKQRMINGRKWKELGNNEDKARYRRNAE